MPGETLELGKGHCYVTFSDDQSSIASFTWIHGGLLAASGRIVMSFIQVRLSLRQCRVTAYDSTKPESATVFRTATSAYPCSACSASSGPPPRRSPPASTACQTQPFVVRRMPCAGCLAPCRRPCRRPYRRLRSRPCEAAMPCRTSFPSAPAKLSMMLMLAGL